MQGGDGLEMEREDLRKICEYQINMTVFADTKAGGFILLYGGLVSALVVSGKLPYAVAALSGSFGLSNIVGLMAFSMLLVSVALLILTIVPRSVRNRQPPSNVIFWQHVARNSASAEYLKRLRSLDNDGWTEQWGEQIYAVASIARAKFARLHEAVWVGVLGSLLAVWLFAIT